MNNDDYPSPWDADGNELPPPSRPMLLPVRRYRVMPHVNSWNLAGWCVEDYWPICMVWSRRSRLYFTQWGARRAMMRYAREALR